MPPAKNRSSSKPDAADLAGTARRSNVANILRRLKAGRTLTRAERVALDEYESEQKAKNGRRLLKLDLARELGMSRTTLDGYLNLKDPPAPKPDAARRYSVDEVQRFIAENSAKAGTNAEIRTLRETLLRMQVERETIELDELRGRYVRKDEIGPAVAIIAAQLTDDLRLKFETELPPKYDGRTTLERQKLNADGIDWVLRRLKHGTKKLT